MKRLLPSVALATVLILGATACDWTTWRGGPTHTGSADGETLINAATVADLDQAWSVPTGPNDGGQAAVIVGDIAILSLPRPSSDGSSTVGVIDAYRLSDGHRLWSRAVRDAPSTPAVADGRVYVVIGGNGRADTRALALDVDTGEDLWVRAVSGREDGTPFAPTVADGRVYISYTGDNPSPTRGGGVVALHPIDGFGIWARQTTGRPLGSPTAGNGAVYVPTDHPSLLALSATDGATRFNRPTTPLTGSAVLRDNLVLVSEDDQRIGAFDARTGMPRWTTDSAGPLFGSSTAVSADQAFSCLIDPEGESGGVVAYSLANGSEQWRAEEEPCVAVTHANGVVLVSHPGGVTFRAADTGELLGTASVPGWKADAVVAHGQVLLSVRAEPPSSGHLVKLAVP